MERKINTLLRIHLRIYKPEKLSAKERAERWEELKWYWDFEKEAHANKGTAEL